MKLRKRHHSLASALFVFLSMQHLYGEEFIHDPRLEGELLELSRQFSGPYIPPEEVRQELVAYVKKRGREIVGIDKGQIVGWLISLRDEETIRGIAPVDLTYKYRSHILQCGSPVAIEALIPVLFKEEPLRAKMIGDVFDISDSHNVAGSLIPFMLTRTPGFSEKMYSWAGNYRDSIHRGEWELMLKVMRQWWKDNEQHFRDRDYAAVKPPVLDVSKKCSDSTPEPAESPSTEVPVEVAKPPPPLPTESVQTPDGNPYAWIAGTALALLGSLFVWTLRRKGQRS